MRLNIVLWIERLYHPICKTSLLPFSDLASASYTRIFSLIAKSATSKNIFALTGERRDRKKLGAFSNMQYSIDLTSRIPASLLKAAFVVEQQLEKRGFEVFLVGGSVRDLILGKKIADLDFTTNAKPAEVIKTFKRVIPVGMQFGTVIVLIQNIPIEVTTYRSESGYADGRHPDTINFGSSLQEDITRRDFTVNGLAYHLRTKVLYDYCNGLADIKKRKLRTIGRAAERFAEDGLRPIRACRFAASNGFILDTEIAAAVEKNFSIIAHVARERFYDEWRKSLKAEQPFLFWQHLFSLKIFSIFFARLHNIKAEKNRQLLFLQILQEKKNKSLVFQCASLWFCEILAHLDSQKNFYVWPTAAEASARKQEIFKQQLKEFFKEQRLPLKESEQVQDLLFSPFLFLSIAVLKEKQFHSFAFLEALASLSCNKNKNKNYKKIFLHLRFYAFLLPHFFAQSSCDAEFLLSVKKEIHKNLFSFLRRPLSLFDLCVNGNDLQKLGLRGKEIGRALQQARLLVLQNPLHNKKEILLHKLKRDF